VQAADGLDPAECFLDPLPDAQDVGIARMTGGSPVDCRRWLSFCATSRAQIYRPQLLDGPALDHVRHRQPLGMAGNPSQPGVGPPKGK
jgi:hypothetical protein